MTIAYIISAYHLPDLLVRLVRRLEGRGTAFFIHVDRKTGEREYRAMVEPLADRRDVVFLERHPCYWGDFGHVRATLKGLRALLDSGTPFDQVVLLTGQDYPVRANVEIEARLADTDGIHMQALPLPNPNWTDGGMDRVEHWHFRIGKRPVSFPGSPFGSRMLNRLWSAPARLLRLHRRFPAGLEPWGGSSYWCMPADCAAWVDGFVGSNPRVVEFFRRVHVPDELFFQTLIMNSPHRDRVTGDNLRYQKWDPEADHPAILTQSDLPAIAATDALYARKFDPRVDAAVLDRLDRSLDGVE